eukprot:CAMPEP_0201522422 /NCGR_PEP_ID=MMETSP0161_2-20130828/17357_1 /ASSEMBLY_ACC=CAM_ASM_000251 /TAXON_ID=180227 /ORGANISM="Neoparamoeba aestuarina, Strain SoJaBio B1-5/56/2" /LENGTH=627 /DNA_ID=CAMNT_0047921263 /DNA_START=88 /DNA_END=1971 /DNA_ORIENTATION=+
MGLRLFLFACVFVSLTYVAHGYIQVGNYLPTTEDELPPQILDLLAALPYDGDDDDWPTDLIKKELKKRDWDIYAINLFINTTAEQALADAIEEANDNIAPLIGIANRKCGQSIIKYITALRLRRSFNVDLQVNSILPGLPDGPLFLPSFPCRSLCTDIEKFCLPPAFPDAAIDVVIPFSGRCNANVQQNLAGGLVIAPSQPLFPLCNDENKKRQVTEDESTHYIVLDTWETYIPSTNFLATPEYVPDCQSPLMFDQESFYEDDLESRACKDHCLGYTFFTEEQWDAAKILLGVLGWFCLVTNLNLMIVLLMSPKNRRYPGIMSVFMCIAGVIINLPFAVGACTGIEEILCTDEFTPADSDHGLCVWQAVFLNWGALMGLLTWSALAVNTYVTLHLRWKLDNFKWGIATYFVVFGYPTIAIIVGTATEDYEFTPPLPWCWWGTTGLEWGMFYAVDILCCFVSIFCIVFVMYELRNIQDSSKGKKAKYLKLVRVFAFLVLFFEIAVYLIIVQSIGTAREDEYTEVTTAYVQCLLRNVVECDRPDDGEGYLSASTWYWLLANVSGTGLPVVLVFGTTAPVFFFWCRAVSNLASGKGLADGLSSSSSSSASSRGSWAGPQDGDEDSYDPDA